MPFAGGPEEGRRARERLARLATRPGDELILVDNTPRGAVPEGQDEVRVVRATLEGSSYHARNVGAEHAAGEWLLFIDADCVPPPDLIDRYFAEPVAGDVGLLAGAIEPEASQRGLLAEWAVTREILSQRRSSGWGRPAAATANLAVRRSVWAELGGFYEGIRSGGDLDFCWRAGDAGWRLEYRPDAAVEHVHRESLRGIARQMGRYAAGNAWQRRRRPDVPAPRPVREIGRALVGAPGFLLTGRPRRGALKLVDGLAGLAQLGGALLSNRARSRPAGADAPRERRLVVATDRFPVTSETFIASEIDALRALGWRVRVEAVARPERPALGRARGLDVRYLEDDGLLDRALATAWVLLRHPLRALADRRLRSRFDPEEWMPLSAVAPQARRLARRGDRHVHAHFAALASVNALRAGRIAGVPVSVAAHGHEVFATPRALRSKLEAAAFAVAPCEYTARFLRGEAPGARVEVVVMGVDGERFRRSGPYPGGRTVLAVGRLVEKKGFEYLLEAAARAGDAVERVVIAGDGPLRERLERRAEELGLDGRVSFLGAVDSGRVRELLEGAALFAVPCVIASDGDRDAMPVVAKEALAMEVPVVASDEVGLPEVVRDGWGRLVPPADAAALAEAIAEVLALPAEERAAMGRAGREFVLAHFDTETQARRLGALIEGVARPG